MVMQVCICVCFFFLQAILLILHGNFHFLLMQTAFPLTRIHFIHTCRASKHDIQLNSHFCSHYSAKSASAKKQQMTPITINTRHGSSICRMVIEFLCTQSDSDSDSINGNANGPERVRKGKLFEKNSNISCRLPQHTHTHTRTRTRKYLCACAPGIFPRILNFMCIFHLSPPKLATLHCACNACFLLSLLLYRSSAAYIL